MSSQASKKQHKNSKIDDATFVKKYLEFGESQSELARHLGVTRQTVADRLRRIGKHRIDEARQAGKSSVVASKTEAAIFAAYEAGQEEGLKQWNYLEHLEQILADQGTLMRLLKQEIEQDIAIPGRRLKPYQVAQLLATQSGAVRTALAINQVRRDIHSHEKIEAFMAGMVEMMIQEVPEIREKLYIKFTDEDSWRIHLMNFGPKRRSYERKG